MVVHLAARLGFSTRVIHPASARRPLRAMLMSHVCLSTNDWLNTLLFALSIKIERSIHVAVIGHAQRGLTIGHRCCNQLIKSRCAIQHRKLGVDMQVGKRISHLDLLSFFDRCLWQKAALEDRDYQWGVYQWCLPVLTRYGLEICARAIRNFRDICPARTTWQLAHLI